MTDFNLPLGIALLAVFAGTEAMALRFVRKGRRGVAAAPATAFVAPMPFDREACEIEEVCAIDQAHQQALRDAYDAHRAEVAEAESRIARAGEFVRRAGLGFAVPYLWEDLRGQAGLVEGAEAAGEAEGEVAWRWRGAAWWIDRETVTGGDPARATSCFSVQRDGETVLAMICQRETGARRFRFVSVEAFEAGPWVAELVDFAGRLRTTLETVQARKAAARTLGAAARIRLGAAEIPAATGRVH